MYFSNRIQISHFLKLNRSNDAIECTQIPHPHQIDSINCEAFNLKASVSILYIYMCIYVHHGQYIDKEESEKKASTYRIQTHSECGTDATDEGNKKEEDENNGNFWAT